MTQPFVITGNVEFAGDQEPLEGRVEAYDRPFCLAYDTNLQAIE